ncbi:MAG: prephenate dehydratase [Terriglobales bacterium]
MRIAIQGELGSFSDEAARTFLRGCSVVPCVTSSDVFDRLDSGRVGAALVPIENSLAGPVAQHLDLLLARDAFVQREFHLRIRHNLIAAPGVTLKDVRRVFSHPVALEQCREFFRRHRQARAESFYDTAGSVRHVVGDNLRDAGAIAGSRAASVYKGRVLLRGLEDDKQNFTRFFLVGRSPKIHRNANKTSIAVALKNAPGALFKALSVFALRDIDLSKIESRPLRGRPFEYVFFIDYLRADDDAARKALAHLSEIAEFVKLLGIYPAA